MNARMDNPVLLIPEAQQAFLNFNKVANASDVPAATMQLVHLRVSQINGCGVCVYGGVHHSKKDGETDERLHSVAIWRESPLFTDAERAALALAEATTRIADRPETVTDEVWDAAAKHYGDKELASLVLYIGLVNCINRVNVATRQTAGATW